MADIGRIMQRIRNPHSRMYWCVSIAHCIVGGSKSDALDTQFAKCAANGCERGARHDWSGRDLFQYSRLKRGWFSKKFRKTRRVGHRKSGFRVDGVRCERGGSRTEWSVQGHRSVLCVVQVRALLSE